MYYFICDNCQTEQQSIVKPFQYESTIICNLCLDRFKASLDREANTSAVPEESHKPEPQT
jgi:predicted nucleic acid-binding Zn ribbon protein